MNELDNLKKIEQLEVQLQHLENDFYLTKAEHSDSTSKYLQIHDELKNKNNELLELQKDLEKQVANLKKVEEALREKDAIFSAFLEHSPYYVFFKDSNIRPILLSRNFESMIGLPLDQIIGKTMDELFPSDLAKRMVEDDKLTLIKKKLIKVDEELNGRHYTTLKFPVEIEGKDPMLAGFTIDITEQSRLEEQLQIRQRMDSLGTLAGGVAHDFNNILVGIMGNLGLLEMESDNFTDHQKKLLRNAGISTKRAANLIKQFQTMSRGGMEPTSIIDLYDIASEVFGILDETTDRLITKKIEFSKEKFFVDAVPSEIHQALLNLGINSAEAIEERGVKKVDYIRITAKDYHMTAGDKADLPEGNYIYLTFKDNGAGMSEEVLRQAFDPLFTTKDKYSKKGQGLGLAMVYNIVTRKCKGHIEINSKEGEGTTFHIYLPKALQEVEKVIDKVAKEVHGGTETILVVDDEEIVRKSIEELLTYKDYRVITVGNGEEALKIYMNQKKSIDLVILDLNMPIMSGQEVFQEMLNINPDVKVIISSGHDDVESRKGILAQAHGNISKPYGMEALAMAIRNVLDSKSRLMQEESIEEYIEIKGGDETILIVDDEKFVISAFKRMIEDFDYKIISATNGKEALVKFKEFPEKIDLVILDLMMPVMSGEEAFEELLKIDPKVKVIISSGFCDDKTQEGILKKAEGFLNKPYDFEDAARIIRKVLDE